MASLKTDSNFNFFDHHIKAGHAYLGKEAYSGLIRTRMSSCIVHSRLSQRDLNRADVANIMLGDAGFRCITFREDHHQHHQIATVQGLDTKASTVFRFYSPLFIRPGC